jgi:hypothetical protein
VLAQSQTLDIGGTLDELNGANALRAASNMLTSLTQSSVGSSVDGNITTTGGFMNSDSNFVNAAGAFVASTTVIGASAGSLYAYGELAAVTTTGVGVDFGGTILLTMGAASDVGGMGIVGASLGAAGGIALLPSFGVGYGLGSLISPWVNRNMIDPLYPLFGLPRY